MIDLPRRGAVRTRSAVLLAWAVFLLAPIATQAQERRVPDTYEATTASMTPAGLTLRIQVLEWSDEAARAAVIGALTGESDVRKALSELPSAGVVWQSGSAVGHSLRYAHRTVAENGEERITLVTDRPLDSYRSKPWSLADGAQAHEMDYSAIELRVGSDGVGTGTLSLATGVEIDAESATVSLNTDDSTPQLLSDVKLMPKPYWARSD